MIKIHKPFGFGMQVANQVYVHVSAVKKLPKKYRDRYALYSEKIKRHLADQTPGLNWQSIELDYHLLKINLQQEAMTFIQMVDFDTVDEPLVNNWVVVGSKGIVQAGQNEEDVLLHKWMTVPSDYAGFDVQHMKLRSQAIYDVNANYTTQHLERYDHWVEHILEKIEPVTRI